MTTSWFLLISAFILTAFPHNAYASLLPQAVDQSTTSRLLYFHPRHFEFCNDGKESTILNEAFERYTTRILENSYPGKNILPLSPESNSSTVDRHHHHHHPAPPGFSKEDAIHSVSVFVVSSDQSLGLQTSETYTLRINAPTTIIHATNVYGALRAMESLAQLAFEIKIDDDDYDEYFLEEEGNDDGVIHDEVERKRLDHLVVVNETSIWDTPRFRHRGLLIDTARHFLPVSIIKSHIDAMEMAKLNVLHWHLVDDQSFPYQSEALPELSEAGAFSPNAVYTVQDIDEIVQYARARGVRIIPEFDMPGHTASWGKSHPELLTQCDTNTENIKNGDESGNFSLFKNLIKKVISSWNGNPSKRTLLLLQDETSSALGPMDPSKESTFSLIWQLLREVSTRFPDAFIHLGGDEVNFDCWKNNKEIATWMQEQDLGKDVRALLPYFVNKVIKLADVAGKEAMVWQEAFDSSSSSLSSAMAGSTFLKGADMELPSSTVVHVWKWASYLTPLSAPHSSLNTTQQDGHKENHQEEQFLKHSSSARRLKVDLNSLKRKEEDASLTTSTTLETRGNNNEIVSTTSNDDSYWLAELAKVTATHRAVLSAPWYLNLAPAGDEHAWEAYWNVEPLNFKASIEQKERVLGGQASVWGELVDETNALQKTWPLAAAVAERLWADDSVRDVDAARQRLEEFRCKLVARGVPAAPIGPGYCP